jgi:hypothetical protein
MRVCSTHCTICAQLLKSWVFDGSLDGETWTEIDRQKNNRDFKSHSIFGIASFPLSKPAECRFIRLTQTNKNHHGDDCLVLRAVEFFGTLSE